MLLCLVSAVVRRVIRSRLRQLREVRRPVADSAPGGNLAELAAQFRPCLPAVIPGDAGRQERATKEASRWSVLQSVASSRPKLQTTCAIGLRLLRISRTVGELRAANRGAVPVPPRHRAQVHNGRWCRAAAALVGRRRSGAYPGHSRDSGHSGLADLHVQLKRGPGSRSTA